MSKTAAYQMNPAEDYLVFGDELKDGMWVMREDWTMRRYDSEDRQIRANRFCRVTHLRTMDAGHGPCAVFIGEWIDGYQEAFTVHHRFAWIVKRDPISAPDSMYRAITSALEGMEIAEETR